MDFESPDVEREFPGLYASESGKRSQESDFSDEAHDRPSKKDLLIGKRKEKKESKKDQGYAALEGESSPEEDVDVKSPSKSKKSKSFKFPTIKEKREKSREKDVKEKDKDREKEKENDKERDKKKDHKSKLKLKDKRKGKHVEDGCENLDDMPVFGVPLAIAVERNHCHDGIKIPVIVRDCIDHVEEYGICVEGIYKVSGVKSKVQLLKRSYNRRENINLNDHDLCTTTSLLKTFLRELPESILTSDLASKFEEAVGIKESSVREESLISLVAQLPPSNQTCLAWIIRHLENVASHERQNKMGISSLSAALSPSLQMSSRVTSALLSHSRALFPGLKLMRYIPPLSTACTELPDSCQTIAAELTKQESLLSQIHSEMNYGYSVRAEQLWEVQRFITQLKRKLKSLEKAQESSVQTQEEHPHTSGNPVAAKIPTALSPPCHMDTSMPASTDVSQKQNNEVDVADMSTANVIKDTPNKTDEVDGVETTVSLDQQSCESDFTDVKCHQGDSLSASAGFDDKANQIFLELEQKELLQFISDLKSRICNEREAIELLQKDVPVLQSCCAGSISCSANQLVCNASCTEHSYTKKDSILNANSEEKDELHRTASQLIQDRCLLIQQIMNEREACIQLRAELQLLELKNVKNRNAPVANELQ